MSVTRTRTLRVLTRCQCVTLWLPGPAGYKLPLYGCSAAEAGLPRKFLIPKYR